MERFLVIWLFALPMGIWLALRLRGPAENLLAKTLATLLPAGAAWYVLTALLITNSFAASRQLSLQSEVRDFWAIALLFPFCIYVASRAAARVTVRQACAVTFTVVLWLGVLWGLMVNAYVQDYGRSPFDYVGYANAVD